MQFQPDAMDWTSDGRYLAANDFVYDYLESNYVGGFRYAEDAWVTAVDWHPDNFRLTRADSMGRIKIDDATRFDNFVVAPIEGEDD